MFVFHSVPATIEAKAVVALSPQIPALVGICHEGELPPTVGTCRQSSRNGWHCSCLVSHLAPLPLLL